MKKKTWVVVIGAAMMLALGACGQEETKSTASTEMQQTATKNEEILSEEMKPEENESKEGDNNTLDGILAGITLDYETTIQKLTTEMENVFVSVGDTYDGYVANAQLVLDWYELVLTEEKDLFARTENSMIACYKLIAATADPEDYDSWDDAMDEVYDVVYEDAMDEFYDAIYEDAMDEMYDTYYDGIIDDASETVDYGDWLDVRSDFYEDWLDVRSDVYDDWLDIRSDFYDTWLDVKDEFYDDNFDMEAFFADEKVSTTTSSDTSKENTDVIEESPEEDAANMTDVASDTEGISPEFKEMMDSYEAFFDEYVEFMKKYMNADATSIVSMMQDYTDYMAKYTEMIQKLNALQNEEMSTEEALYYTEVSARITQKLLELQ